uniref:Zinc finger C2H2 LYAR-type domain-containing protein n=1 Tax=Panagrolaimus sp. JU765 TaxID=591449 RepID=A0AC34QEM0_9BILA
MAYYFFSWFLAPLLCSFWISALEISTTPKPDDSGAGIIIIAFIAGAIAIFAAVLITCFCCCRSRIRQAQINAEKLALLREEAAQHQTASAPNQSRQPPPKLDPNKRRSTLKDVFVCLLRPDQSAAKTKKFKMIIDKRKEAIKNIRTGTPAASVSPVSLVDVSQPPKNSGVLSQHSIFPENEIVQIGAPVTSECKSNEKVVSPESKPILKTEKRSKESNATSGKNPKEKRTKSLEKSKETPKNGRTDVTADVGSSNVKPLNDTKEPNLFQTPVVVQTRKGETIHLNAVFQDTLPGGSDKGVVINIHGAPGSHKDYKYVNPKLEAAGIRIVGINFPGCGYTDYDERLENHNFERVQFVQQIVDVLNLAEKSAIFIGHSRGSENALKMAVLNEEKSVGFVSVNPIGIRPHRGAHIRLFTFLANFWRILWLRWLSNWVLYQIYTKFAQFKVLDGHTCGVAMCMLTSLDYADAKPYIKKYNTDDLQAVLLYGGNDWLIEPEISREFLALFDNEYEFASFKVGEDEETTKAVVEEILDGRKTVGIYCAKDGHFLQKERANLIAESILAMFQRKLFKHKVHKNVKFRMVVFVCVSCGESLKKNKVTDHRARCSMNAVSCMDCHKDFDFSSYATHYTCVTEEQRVQGSLYKPKEDKTGMKRQAWYDSIEKAIAESKNQQVVQLLKKIQIEPNVPVKFAPFKNFVKNKYHESSEAVAQEAFNAIKTIYGSTKEVPTPVVKKDGFNYNQGVKDLISQCPSEGISVVDAFRIMIAAHRALYPEGTVSVEEICENVSLDVFYQDTCPGTSLPTFVALHGSPGSHKDFKYITPNLVEAGIRVVGINFPGLGFTQHDDTLKYDNLERNQLIQQVVDGLKLEKIVFCGHSRGSENALMCGVSNPDKTVGIVLINPTGLYRHKGIKPKLAINFLAALWRIVWLRFLSEILLYRIYQRIRLPVKSGKEAGVCLQNMTQCALGKQKEFIDKLNKNDQIQVVLAMAGQDNLLEEPVNRHLVNSFEKMKLIEVESCGDDSESCELLRNEFKAGHKRLGFLFLNEGHYLNKYRARFVADSVVEMFKIKN